MENTLVVHDLNISFGAKKIFDKFSISIPKGQFVAITGNNGSGKSTLMKAIIGIIPYKGHIHLAANKIGYLPQSFSIDRTFPISVFDFFKSFWESGSSSSTSFSTFAAVILCSMDAVFKL